LFSAKLFKDKRFITKANIKTCIFINFKWDFLI
jgi:hypothetical protein